MPFLPIYEWLGIDLTKTQKWIINATSVALAIFVLIDWGVIHPMIWDNAPDTMYWLAKPVWVAGPMLVAAWWAITRGGFGRMSGLAVAGFVGILSLQLYYTVIPVPLQGGESLHIGLLGNLTEGLVVHFGALAIGLVAVVLLYKYVV